MDGGDRLRSHVASLRCVGCGRRYVDGHVLVRAARETVSFVDLVCRGCGRHASAVATLRTTAGAAMTVDLGDLDEAAAGVIEVEDVTEMSRFLDGFDGDFRRLFGSDGSPLGDAPA